MRSRKVAVVALLVIAFSAVFPAIPVRAAISPDQFETCLLTMINAERAEVGSSPVARASDLTDQVRDWSEWMSNNEFKHTTSEVRADILPEGWRAWGENIAWHSDPDLPDCSAIHGLLMNSDGHRRTIQSPSYRFVALGAHVDSSGWWVTELFFDAVGYPPTCNGTFCDDDTSIFEGAIESLAAAGITTGCNPPTNDRYCPDRYVTRGAMAAFLSRALGLPTGPSTDFIDDNDSIFEGAIERLAAAGITTGCNPPTNDRYCPDRYVTRGQMAAFLARALDL